MFVELDPVIDNYIKDHFTYEFGSVIKESFTLFSDYGLVDYQLPYFELLLTQSVNDPQKTLSDVLAELNNKLDYILSVHGVSLIDQVNPLIKNVILRGMLSYIDSFEEYKLAVENFLDDDEMTPEEKFSNVISHFMNYPITSLLEHIESISPDLILKMKSLINNPDEIMRSPAESIAAYKLFKDYLVKTHPQTLFTVADSLILSSFLLGLELKEYLPYANSYLFKLKAEELYINIFSLYVISSNYLSGDYIDTLNEIQDYFSDYLNTGISSLNLTDGFTQLLNKFNDYIKELPVE